MARSQRQSNHPTDDAPASDKPPTATPETSSATDDKTDSADEGSVVETEHPKPADPDAKTGDPVPAATEAAPTKKPPPHVQDNPNVDRHGKPDVPKELSPGPVNDTPQAHPSTFNPLEKNGADFDNSDGEGVSSQQPSEAHSQQPMIDAALNQAKPGVSQHPADPDLKLKTYEVYTQGQSLGRVSNVTDESGAISAMCKAKGLVASKHTFKVEEVPSATGL